MLPCIVIDLFLNNQPDALIIQIYSVIKLYIRPILTLLGNGHQNLHETYQCRMYSRELLMMGRENARNMENYVTE
jgi:hypothetical protein